MIKFLVDGSPSRPKVTTCLVFGRLSMLTLTRYLIGEEDLKVRSLGKGRPSDTS